ncbi:unnamed protein product [Schistocephalus solidus]|uniref:N-acetyltransferase domain-containing protein n=1 Tax=Schistocephalus solidus TaxID=70667 RepID=A0A183T4Y6_SCHSO|nr:unnamed protein product [Schistocephalus solidus]
MVPPYWTPHGDRAHFLWKLCTTAAICQEAKEKAAKECMREWYMDWRCVECCQGELCNYYATINMAVDTVCVGVTSFEEFSCLLGVSHGDHFGCVPIEALVTVHGVRKHEGQGIASVDGQFMLVYLGPKLSTCMAHVSAKAICKRNAVNDIRLFIFYCGVFDSR